MASLLHLHIVTFFIIFINFLIFNKKMSNDLGTKYFLINYIYHNHKQLSCFLIIYPFVIILIYFLWADVFLLSCFFISVLHVYFLFELTSKKNITKREAYISWYKYNAKHSFSMHAYDMLRNDFKFLNEKLHRVLLFKFELIFFISLVIESEVLNEVFTIIDNMK
ncbi:hypothetical protein ACH5BF_08335 [Arcobacter sp. YIC-464]|uniref:hypothetical protein n=1 Tax=Arcobacter sp. YIC-464 TaxID=3376631 RepID=UPI003C243919